MPRENRSVTQAHDAQAIIGVQKYLLDLPSITLAAIKMTPSELDARLQARIDSANAVAKANAEWRDLVQAHRALSQGLLPILRGLRQYLLNTYGEANAPLADFGMNPPKKVAKSPEAKVAAAEKSAATRKARHTAGKKQKKAIKGTVTAPAPASPPSDSPPGPAPAPSGGPRAT